MQILDSHAVARRLTDRSAPAFWYACIEQQPPLAPRPRRLYCAWLRDAEGDLALASDTAFDPPAANRAAFAAAADRLGTVPVDPRGCYRIEPASIPKPWGTELWYTGIEARGEARLSDGGRRLALGVACALFPDAFGCPGAQPPRLLKRLCPHHEPVVGDLYFEVHARKQESYLVTRIDARAWPEGTGEVRFGLRPGVDRTRLKSALRALESARSASDRYLPALPEPLTAQAWSEMRASVPAAIASRESRARAAVEALIDHRPLRPGDVLTVPPGVPHGLRHGVEVVELQTPDYERCVLYASQPVVTQSGWDIDTGMALIESSRASAAPPPVPRWLRLPGGSAVDTDAGNAHVCLIVDGRVRIRGMTLQAGDACWLRGQRIHAPADAVCVLARVT